MKMDYSLSKTRTRQVALDTHPEACTLGQLREYAASSNQPLAVDLFCGGGGLSLGLTAAGYKLILAADHDANSINTHRAYFGGASEVLDLSDPEIIGKIIGALQDVDVSLIAGGPPCQPFSIAGRNKIRSLVREHGRGKDQRRDLWQSFVEIVENVRPRAVLVENVPGLLSEQDMMIISGIRESLEHVGYDVYTRVLAASDFGVPQRRHRVFVVGVQQGSPFTWPEARQDQTTLREAIGDLPETDGSDNEQCKFYSGPQSPFQRLCRTGVAAKDSVVIYDHVTRAVRADDLEAFKLMNSKTLYSDLPEHLRRYRSDIYRDKYKRLDWDDVSRTITAHIAKDGYAYIHPDQHRTITVREAARIQSFPDWYRFSGYRTSAFAQIGNAVPPMLAAVLARSILRATRADKHGDSLITGTDVRFTILNWLTGQNSPGLSHPWRAVDDPWLLILGLILLEQERDESRHIRWELVRTRWETPSAYLSDNSRTSMLLTFGQQHREAALDEVANIMKQDAWRAESLKEIDLPQTKLDLALHMAGISLTYELPASANRTACRIQGDSISSSRYGTRLAIANAIGLDKTGRGLAGLLEIGDRYCHRQRPKCQQCPIHHVCATGRAKGLRNNSLPLDFGTDQQ